MLPNKLIIFLISDWGQHFAAQNQKVHYRSHWSLSKFWLHYRPSLNYLKYTNDNTWFTADEPMGGLHVESKTQRNNHNSAM